ncbi:MAG: thiamine phosphate synthase, partial [Gammaproteobacteria bacterium]
KEGQPLEWVPLDELHSKEMPPANQVIKKLISLPPIYLITPDVEFYDQDFLSRIEAFLQNGLKLLQFRSRKSPFPEHEGLVRELAKQCKHYACRLLYNGSAEQTVSLGADGVHLSSARLMDLSARPLPPENWVAASCHDRRELEHAVGIGADFCVLSSVHESSSHPGADVLGWQKFRTLAESSTIPVYALGGVKPGDILEARNNGAHGLAMISGIWDATDPVSIIKRTV